MSTRSEIIIKDYGIADGKKWKEQLKLYHRYDGYPEGVGQFLYEKVLPKLQNSNGIYADQIANFLVKNKEDDTFEITAYNHVIEYQYIIDIPKKKIECYGGYYSSWDNPRARFIRTDEYDLEKICKKVKFNEIYS